MQEDNQDATESSEIKDVEHEDDSENVQEDITYAEAESRAAELSEEERAQRVQILKPIVEGAIMAAGEALRLNKIQSLFDEFEMPSKGLLIETLEGIQRDCEGRGFDLVEVASGWRFQVREDYAPWVNRLWEEKPQKYSRALLETLALVAYRQPITRGDIEQVRGVAVSSHIMKTLTEREWVKVVGHRDVPGRPALYATTKQFLDYFNMKSLDELPTLGELQDIDSLNESLEFNEADAQPVADSEELEDLSSETARSEDVKSENVDFDHEDSDDTANFAENQDEQRLSRSNFAEGDIKEMISDRDAEVGSIDSGVEGDKVD